MPGKITHEEFVSALKIINPNVNVLGIYLGTKTKIEVQCVNHGVVWKAYPDNLRKGKGCYKCKSEKIISARGLSHNEFVAKLQSINPNIEVIGEYRNCKHPILAKCRKHDVTWYSIGERLLRGEGCLRCGVEKNITALKLSTSDAIKRLDEINQNIRLVGEVNGASHRSRFKCLDCGNEWETAFNNISNGTGCPHCASSKGENEVRSFLDSAGIVYIYQHSFDDCRNMRILKYDFYIPSRNIAIEFQGQQHFHPVDFAGRGEEWANERFLYGQNNDSIKRDYCQANNITLVEIRYDEIDKIPDILNSVFFAKKVISA